MSFLSVKIFNWKGMPTCMFLSESNKKSASRVFTIIRLRGMVEIRKSKTLDR